MRFRLIFASMIVLVLSMGIYGCSDTYRDVVRIHIRANSNEVCDQSVKLKVRDSVIDYITPIIMDAVDVEEVKCILEANIPNIVKVADKVLQEEGYEYRAIAYVDNEFFPTRVYGEYTFPADYYDALVINLGTGDGDNWWCVAYPPLCFVTEGEGRVVYKSKIWEIINKYFG